MGSAPSPSQQQQQQPLQLQPYCFFVCRRHYGLLVACCVIFALSLMLLVCMILYLSSSESSCHTAICRRSNSGVRCKPSSYSTAACSSFVTRGGYPHLVLLRAHCCCCEVRAAGRAFSYHLPVQKSKATHTDVLLMVPPAPFFFAIQAHTLIKSKQCDTKPTLG